MHIGLYSPGWPIDHFPNGIVTYVHHLRAELLNQGHRVTVFAKLVDRRHGDTGIVEVRPTTKYRAFRKLSGLLGSGPYDVMNFGKAIGFAVNRVGRNDPIDILEMEESFGWCAEAQKRVSCPIVVKLHGPAFLTLIDEDRQTEFAATKIAMEGEGLRHVAAIISPSKTTLSSTVARYGLSPRLSRVIPNLMEMKPGLKLWNMEECDAKTILFVGRFEKLKGGDTALLAFRRLLETDDSLKLIFVGPDRGLTAPGRPRIFFDEYRNSLFAEPSRGRIDYRGQLPQHDLADLRRKAMLTMVVSRWENQGYTAIEAMNLGCPVVSTAVGGMNEVIEHGVTGLLARPNDIADLCAQMSSLLKNPGRARQLGENARRFVNERFTGGKFARETVDLYREVISMAKAAKN